VPALCPPFDEIIHRWQPGTFQTCLPVLSQEQPPQNIEQKVDVIIAEDQRGVVMEIIALETLPCRRL
jgi:hypothetical protein